MSLITALARLTDLILFEEGEEVNFCRETITLKSGGAACVVGQVLGKVVTAGTATETHAGSTGNGAMTLDATTPVQPNAQTGLYSVKCITAQTNAGIFRVYDPMGRVLGDYTVGAAAFSNQIKFTIADGATDFVVGDTFLITVKVDTIKYIQVAPASNDGSQVATAVCLEAADPTSADKTVLALVRGPALLKDAGLVWTSGMTTAQKTAAKTQLAAVHVGIRQALGA